MGPTDQSFDRDNGVLLDQYAIAMKAYDKMKAHVSHLKDTVPSANSTQEHVAQFREEVLKASQVGIAFVRGEIQSVDSSNLTDIQKKTRNDTFSGLEVMSEELYRLLLSLPK